MEPYDKDWIKRKQARRSRLSPSALFEGIRDGDVNALSAGITLIESTNPNHRSDANDLINKCLPLSGDSIRVGITGVPGVGKSTFIESFGKIVAEAGKKLAVLAVDPSSAVSGGSILGDKTRMQNLSTMNSVFIRPSPSGETLGGVARRTRESIVLCEAAGFDFVLIETVGVGQSETMVKSMVDFFLLLMLAGAGDELQGIKKGIMEMADAIVITKADGDNVKHANRAAQEYRNALHLFPPMSNGWTPQVHTASAIENEGIDRIVDLIYNFGAEMKKKGFIEKNRREQDKQWLINTLKEMILNDFFLNAHLVAELDKIEDKVLNGSINSFEAADILYKLYKQNGKV